MGPTALSGVVAPYLRRSHIWFQSPSAPQGKWWCLMGAPSPKLGRGGDLHSPIARLDFPSHSPIVHPNVLLYGPTLPQFPPSLPPPTEDGMSPLPPPTFRAQPLEALPDYRGSVGDPHPPPPPYQWGRDGEGRWGRKSSFCAGAAFQMQINGAPQPYWGSSVGGGAAAGGQRRSMPPPPPPPQRGFPRFRPRVPPPPRSVPAPDYWGGGRSWSVSEAGGGGGWGAVLREKGGGDERGAVPLIPAPFCRSPL